MSEVSVQINRKQYTISCDPGQEQQVIDLANTVDARIQELVSMGGGSNETHLLVLNSIMMANELMEARGANSASGQDASLKGLQITEEDEAAITDAINKITQRINAIEGNLQAL